MGFLASRVAQIPAAGFEWYVTLLEDGWDDNLRRELSDNFEHLAEAAGPGALVVRGFDRERFAGDIAAAYRLSPTIQTPALIVSDVSPSVTERHPERLNGKRVITIPLARRGSRAGSISELLSSLVLALRSEDAMKSLEHADPARIEHWWGWLRYLDLKPGFLGFNVDVNAILERQLFGIPRPKPRLERP